ncbi:MAG: Spy/CpxP family protein refolding chaperone, partial [Acidobacteriaceae bacterium]
MLLTRKNRPSLVFFLASLLCFATAAVPCLAQDGHSPDQAMDHGQPPPEHHGNHGRWWDNPHVAQKIGLTDAQKQQMNQIFDKHRPQLKELNATLKREEDTLHPLLQADNLDEHKVLHQIDTIAQARANLEKANARMLFGLRKILTPDQWKKLQEMAREWHEHH